MLVALHLNRFTSIRNESLVVRHTIQNSRFLNIGKVKRGDRERETYRLGELSDHNYQMF